LTPATCPACGGSLAPWRSVPAGEPSDRASYPLSRCVACGTAVTGGDPPESKHYETGVYAPRPPRLGAVVRALQRVTVGQPVRELRHAGLAPGGRVLDVGAGRGRLVAELARRGYDASGIEPSARSAGLAATAGLPVAAEAIEDHSDEGLDAAVLWHVAEHLDDPAAALERVAGWLRPGGLVLVAVPNIDSLQARIGGPGWLHLDAPRHRLHLTPPGLEALLHRAGLTPVRWSHAVWEHNPAGMWMALLARAGMTPGLPFHLLKRNARATPRDLALLALGVPLAPMAVALEAVAAASKRGGTIAVVARRSS
jgi:SAM-dependent methyltransferase